MEVIGDLDVGSFSWGSGTQTQLRWTQDRMGGDKTVVFFLDNRNNRELRC